LLSYPSPWLRRVWPYSKRRVVFELPGLRVFHMPDFGLISGVNIGRVLSQDNVPAKWFYRGLAARQHKASRYK